MPFSISFCDTPLVYEYDDPSTAGAEGLLILGDWKESFLASLYEWTKQDYEHQWRTAITAVIQGADKAALITEYVGPEVSANWSGGLSTVSEKSSTYKIIFCFMTSWPNPFPLEMQISSSALGKPSARTVTESLSGAYRFPHFRSLPDPSGVSSSVCLTRIQTHGTVN
jgi:hypothetical protein